MEEKVSGRLGHRVSIRDLTLRNEKIINIDNDKPRFIKTQGALVRELTFTSDGNLLAGTLQLPQAAGPHPAALLISGSGPIDRNSNTRRLKIDAMRQLATRLDQAGIASFRFDKRGIGASSGDYYTASLLDNVSDAAAALSALTVLPEVDARRVFVIGHSEGALIAAELAGSQAPVAGVVLLAGVAQPGEAVLRWQAAQVSKTLPGPVTWLLKVMRQDVLRAQSKRLEQIKASTRDVIRIQLARLNAKWFREFLAYDPSEALRRIEVPVLAVTGSKDIQVDPDEVERIGHLVGSDFSGHVIDSVTHLLRNEAGPPSLRTYKKQARRPVDRRVLDTVVNWITGQVGGPTDRMRN
jgi:pimeloyl-ACP methyl ester carboxylesterase